MSSHDDGGNAFPMFKCDSSEERYGMSLRDYFAAKAMQAELASSSFGDAAEALARAAIQYGVSIEARIADNAYRLADAMLEARKK